MSILWQTKPALLPRFLWRRIRSTQAKVQARKSPSSTLTSLQSSISPSDTLRSLRGHRWSHYDAQYLFLMLIGLFALSIVQQPGAFVKFLVAAGLMAALLLPITRQFFLPFLPIAGWLVLFYSCKFISGEYRPPIWVRVLPALENIFYGANLSNILSAHKHVVLDVLAWLPYGITHFGAPFVCSMIMFVWGPPGIVPVFARTFGYMNLAGVIIQLLFPCSPPWYENIYGLAPANYSMPGSPAGLAAIDKLFGVDLYTSTFTASPVVFGAFPSLHAANATCEALFMSHVFPRLKALFVIYTLWIWWATMYLSHHYAVDLVGGSLLACVFFFIAKSKFVPRMQPGKEFRWDYDYVEFGEVPEESYFPAYDGHHEYRMGRREGEDRWVLASSSASIFSTSSSAGYRSPSTTSGAPRISSESGQTQWDSELGRASTDEFHCR